MFVPKLYRSEDLELMKKIINENAFALLISNQEKLWATHSMFLWNEAEEGFLETHISKANPQAKYLNDGDEVSYNRVYHITTERYEESPEIMVEIGDVLLTKDGAGIGNSAGGT